MRILSFYIITIFTTQLINANLIREKRVDDNNESKRLSNTDTQLLNSEAKLRTKRIETERDKKVVLRTKRIDIDVDDLPNTDGLNAAPQNAKKSKTWITQAKKSKKWITQGMDRIRKIWNNSHVDAKNHVSKKIKKRLPKKIVKQPKNIQESILKPKNEESTITNEINPFSLLGQCKVHKINKTYVTPNCEPVQIESSVCMGSCESHMQIVPQQTSLNQAIESCTFCGPVEYIKRSVYFQCHVGTVKRRRWKLELRTVLIAKTCGCLEDFCYNLNRVTNERMNNFS